MPDQPEIFSIDTLDYDLPEELIAQHPLPDRDQSKLLVVDRATQSIRDEHFPAILNELKPGDLLVLNDTKVVPAKINARRATGGRVSGLFVAETESGVWQLLLTGSKRLKTGEILSLGDGIDDVGTSRDAIRLSSYDGKGRWTANLSSDDDTPTVLNRVGKTPLPPYIHRKDRTDNTESEDRQRYQTVFADKPGAVAAPTAGLHFTTDLLDQLAERGVGRAFVTLHVGIGTFAPIKAERLSDHKMHFEWFHIPDETATRIAETRQNGGRVVAVGTTSVRTLETWGKTGDTTGTTDLFITPPYRFNVVDALITNFHLPRSTLLALVMAFAGIDLTRRVYDHAVAEKYRFFSYGDAMFLA